MGYGGEDRFGRLMVEMFGGGARGLAFRCSSLVQDALMGWAVVR